MKHLLILISILLLSSPVIGNNHKGETLYLWGTSYFDSEWNEFGDKKIHPVYKGDVKNGVPNGQGTLTFPDGSTFIGEYKDGLPNGQGTTNYTFGEKYVGEWKDGMKHGQGKVISPDGDKWVGEFKEGDYHGLGTYTWSDGRKYVGEFKDGKPWNGTSYHNNGNPKYIYVNGKPLIQ